jgi:probable rRNA maturation factor
MYAAIGYYAENITFSLKKKKVISSWLQEIIRSEKKTARNISYIFCDDSFLLEMNKQYLDHDTYTDTITFDYNEGDEISGDIFISIDRVGENALKFKKPFFDELYRVMCHGMLHLAGYSDTKKQERLDMTAKEGFYLSKLKKLLNVPRETSD